MLNLCSSFTPASLETRTIHSSLNQHLRPRPPIMSHATAKLHSCGPLLRLTVVCMCV